ncbi:MAG TPA: NADP-dependent isocitrate dehydrogenase [Actinomycetota bacterium]|nr:NADP-dependent isocitrate dehydrogenase [Actinomycetota bacterium]
MDADVAPKTLVTVILGDGIGPEVVRSAQRIIEAAGARIDWEKCEAGAQVFEKGLPSGVPPETIESISKTRVVLKGPLETPVGFGEKSANVTLRKLFETYANVRPARELPGVETPYSGRGIDLVVVRENVEDLYAGIEYMQSPGVAQALKLISRKGCEKIARFAFELARAEGRTKVHCATKSNIMKLTEGLLKRTFEDVSKDYPDIEANHIIVDNCAHQLVKRPEQFEVIVTTNMNGDILSDESSALIGGLGFAPSANIGNDVAIFEAVHGSAPKYAGKDVINPTALILTAVMMLRHIGEFDVAADVEHAVLVTLEAGVRTGDIVGYDKGAPTTAYTDAIIANLGKRSERWKVRDYKPIKLPEVDPAIDFVKPDSRAVVGLDVFVESPLTAAELGASLMELTRDTRLSLVMIGNRGTKVFPPTGAITDLADHYRCRFIIRENPGDLPDEDVHQVLARISRRHRWMHIEKLQEFDGELGFTRDQGEN